MRERHGAGGGAGNAARGGAGGSRAIHEGVDLDPVAPPICGASPRAGLVLLGRREASLVAIRADGGALEVPFPGTGELELAQKDGAVAVFTHSNADTWAVALFDVEGRLVHATTGALPSGASAANAYSLRLEDAGTIVVTRPPDRLTWDRDLLIHPDGSVEHGFFPAADADGWAYVALSSFVGLYNVDTHEQVAALGSTATYWLRDGRTTLVSAAQNGAQTDVVVTDARNTREYSLPMDLDAVHAPPLLARASVVLVSAREGPDYRIDLETDEAQPFWPEGVPFDPSWSEHMTWDPVTFRPADSALAAWFGDPESGVVVRLDALGADRTAAVHAGDSAWLVEDAGAPRWAVSRVDGAVSELASIAVSGERRTFPVSERNRLLVTVDGRPAAWVDAADGSVATLRADGLGAADDDTSLERTARYVLGTASGLPRWIVPFDGGPPRALPTADELGLSGVASDFLASDAGILFFAAGIPRASWSYDTGRAVVADASTLGADPAASIELLGGWAFGWTARSDPEWFPQREVSWRAPLATLHAEALPDPPLLPLYDPLFVLSPGSNLEHYVSRTPRIFSDGNVATVRRDADAASVFAIAPGATGWSRVGLPLTHVGVVAVEHTPGFWTLSNIDPDCFCALPILAWPTEEADPSVLEQLVLTAIDDERIIRSGRWAFTRDSGCLAATAVDGRAFAVDLVGDREVELPTATAWRWIEAS